ncbi:hypothetical protein [Sphingobacterium bambusae]|uniref:Alpha-L-arabinofuranosidase C-terminal domain-containing protein n=1 Tax=Sphingobacterium bambusae TaxID=662858 RepID=A0ABW6BGC2_9SPHI|nr:hypothetical protein [Sphingobacterium bambusae]WPL50552.1 hypothetical protein SCB77_08835 [Sphingobacterium bambusae]
MQQLFGVNTGSAYIPTSVQIDQTNEGVRKRISFSVLEDSLSNSLIVKAVNVLPVEVQASVDLSGFTLAKGTIEKSTLSGELAARNVLPVHEQLHAEFLEQKQWILKPYSVTVFRFPLKEK